MFNLKNIIATSIGITFLNGCSLAPPKVTMPDGSNRIPINSVNFSKEYNAQKIEEATQRQERQALASRIEAMNVEIGQLKNNIKSLQMSESRRTTSETGLAVKDPLQLKVNAAGTPPLTNFTYPSGSIQILENSILFIATHPFAKTEFNPSDEFKKKLLEVAPGANFIEIRGRTDSEVDNSVDRKIADNRAKNAKIFLIKNGINSQAINTSSVAFGSFISENNTKAGRGLNRRVEIEIKTVNAKAYTNLIAPTTMSGVN
jgi:outer membrane protein OmpA-like peptidoglycan-associated protein